MKPFADRKKEFLEEYGKLREKYQCDVLSIPNYVPSERHTWELVITPEIMDLAQPVPSTFTMEGK